MSRAIFPWSCFAAQAAALIRQLLVVVAMCREMRETRHNFWKSGMSSRSPGKPRSEARSRIRREAAGRHTDQAAFPMAYPRMAKDLISAFRSHGAHALLPSPTRTAPGNWPAFHRMARRRLPSMMFVICVKARPSRSLPATSGHRELHRAPGATVAGRVLSPQGTPVVGAQVDVTNLTIIRQYALMVRQKQRQMAAIASGGLITDKYDIHVKRRSAYYYGRQRLDCRTAYRYRVNRRESRAVPDLAPTLGAKVEGTLVDAQTGKPIADYARLQLEPSHIAVNSPDTTIARINMVIFLAMCRWADDAACELSSLRLSTSATRRGHAAGFNGRK